MRRHLIDIFAAASMAALSAVSCAKETEPSGNGEGDKTKNKITITASLPEELDTKVAFAEGESALKLSWETTDVIRVISETGKSETYSVKEINGKTATFEGNELEGTKFTAVYPGNYETTDALGARSYTGQVQAGNASTAHLQLNAMATELADIQNISFTGENVKLNGAVKLYMKLPEYVTKVNGVTLSAASEIFFTDNAGSAKTNSLGVSFENADVPADHVFTAYMMSSWTETVIAKGTELTVTVVADGVSFRKVFSVTDDISLAGGHVNTIQLNDGNWNAVLEGSGTEADPYKLSTTFDLLAMKSVLVKGQTTYFKLMNDIDMASIDNWQPLNPGYNASDDPSKPSWAYNLGIDFNGDGHTLNGLKSKNTSYASFFGVLYGNCYNVKFVNATVEATGNTGSGIIGGYIGTAGLPGYVHDVTASGTVTNNAVGQPVGGLCGTAREATIENCRLVNVTVTNNVKSESVGGLCGIMRGATVRGCEADVKVINNFGDGTTGGRTAAGGVAGRTNDNTNIISGCVVRGSVEITEGTSNTYTGGIVGYEVKAGAQITDCDVYATVKSAGERVGGIVGHYQGGTLSGCKFYGEVIAATQYAGGIAGITSKESTIKNCLSVGKVNCKTLTGGIVGMNESTLAVEACESSATITGADREGGIIGSNNASLTIRRCASSAIIEATGNQIGGIIGCAVNNKIVEVSDCIFTGSIIEASQRVGGIVGDLGSGSSVCSCYVSGSINGLRAVGGIAGVACNNGAWKEYDKNFGNKVTKCIVWCDNIEARSEDTDAASSGAIIGFTAIRNTLADCFRKHDMTLTANYCSDLYNQENADDVSPLMTDAVVGYTYNYPYHGSTDEPDITSSDLAQHKLDWDPEVWNFTGSEPTLK